MITTKEAIKAHTYLSEHNWSLVSESDKTLVFKLLIDDREHIDIIELHYYDDSIWLKAYNTFMISSINLPIDIYQAVITIAKYKWG